MLRTSGLEAALPAFVDNRCLQHPPPTAPKPQTGWHITFQCPSCAPVLRQLLVVGRPAAREVSVLRKTWWRRTVSRQLRPFYHEEMDNKPE